MRLIRDKKIQPCPQGNERLKDFVAKNSRQDDARLSCVTVGHCWFYVRDMSLEVQSKVLVPTLLVRLGGLR